VGPNVSAFLRCFGAGVRATLYDVSVSAGLSIAEALECARVLEADGHLKLHGREDGADRRRMVELTAAGRRRLRALSRADSEAATPGAFRIAEDPA
jgi:DNA-binding MarR family transcriptional regulator